MPGQGGVPVRHQGEPLVVTKNSLLLHSAIPPSTCTRYQQQSCHSHPMLVPSTGPNCSTPSAGASGCGPNHPSGFLHLPLLLRGDRSRQMPLPPTANDSPARTCCQCWSCCLYSLPVPAPLVPAAEAAAHTHVWCLAPVPIPRCLQQV